MGSVYVAVTSLKMQHFFPSIRAADLAAIVNQKEYVPMPYRALWLRGEEVMAAEEFADLLEAKRCILAELQTRRRKDGVTAVKVVGNGHVCFTIG